MKHANIAFFVPHAGCPHQCSFCDQRAISGQAQPPSPEEVKKTLLEALPAVQNRTETEIAFFGGSFTAIERRTMISLLEAAAPFVGPDRFSGIRISTRPDAVDLEILSILRTYHVTSVELGAQSMDDRVLTANRRGHTAGDVRRASRLIQKSGFSLGLQMMTGLYQDTDAGAWQTAQELARLRPDTMRIYPTVVLRGTELARRFQDGSYHPPTLEKTIPLCAHLLRYFALHDIQVIRLGLHANREIEGKILGGAYHPALRELCEGELLYSEMRDLLRASEPGSYQVSVHPSMISRIIGHGRRNVTRLQALGYRLSVRPDAALSVSDLKIQGAQSAAGRGAAR
ncbi:MAG: radical SAM protein [Provencibacterium sp.]|jgi:histone acetyltransferase (RNA polymerase elongator complex component)|nr:radical SAM protein [Provencibacterium sp.]